MNKKTFYFNTAHAVEVHDWIINNSGGLHGIREIGLLDSALEHIQNDDYYPNFEEKLTHLVFATNKFHAFTDGNKRSSLVLGTYFLELNGYNYCIKKFIIEMEEIVVWLAESKISKELLQEIITSLIFEDEYCESLKLSIYEAVSV